MLLVHSEHPSSRLRYVARQVLERMLGWPVVFVAEREAFRTAEGPKVFYGATPEEGAFHLPASEQWNAPLIGAEAPKAERHGDDLVLWGTARGHDVVASTFHLLSLADEYCATARDGYGRVPPEELTLVRARSEDVPWVDRWAVQLADALRKQYPGLPPPKRAYRHVWTVDVDNALKYRGRSLHRAIGASVRELARGRFNAVGERWRVRTGLRRDPYAVLPDVLADISGRVDRTIAFFLMRGNNRFDHAANMWHPSVQGLVRAVAARAEAAVHPSFWSSNHPDLIAYERKALARIAGRTVRASRQHFLRWRMPGTFRVLADLGLHEDHSIGFSDRAGFRAGTCTPFPWYDLEREQETGLMLHPFATMDSALQDPMGAPGKEALRSMQAMSDAVRAVGGTFISVWHDRFLSGHGPYAKWPALMTDLVDHARA